KAAGGGGGRGMRRVESKAGIEEALDSAAREAGAAFGSEAVFAEKLITRARHIEVQIFGDSAGNAVHLGDRDCTVQRRYPKVVEEAPAPGVPLKIRTAMHNAAVKLARALSYENAGTVEFLLTPGGEFYFLEINSRLQVEHP